MATFAKENYTDKDTDKDKAKIWVEQKVESSLAGAGELNVLHENLCGLWSTRLIDLVQTLAGKQWPTSFALPNSQCAYLLNSRRENFKDFFTLLISEKNLLKMISLFIQ